MMAWQLALPLLPPDTSTDTEIAVPLSEGKFPLLCVVRVSMCCTRLKCPGLVLSATLVIAG